MSRGSFNFGTITNCPDYAGVLIFKCLDKQEELQIFNKKIYKSTVNSNCAQKWQSHGCLQAEQEENSLRLVTFASYHTQKFSDPIK